MAKLSANGVELARLRGKSIDPEYDETTELEYSIRSNGRVMKKTRFTGPNHRPVWSGWRHASKWNGHPEALAYTIRTIREDLEYSYGCAVEVVTA